jgi:hypothetical protein
MATAMSESEKRAGVHLPAPVQLAPADNAKFKHYPRTTKLEWTPVAGAVSYTVDLDYCEGNQRDRSACVDPQPLILKENPPLKGILGTTYQFLFLGAQPGRWRVWAVDKEGRTGFKSPWRRFFYQL